MKYSVRLSSPVSKSFRCQKAANALDIDVNKKSVHTLNIEADIDEPFDVGLIVGASGSGKTTLARQIYGDKFKEIDVLDPATPVIEQFPDAFSYEDCAKALMGVGLSSVPCWIRPASTLSNGQKVRAEVALRMAQSDELTIIDEWTSVVDRTVAKVMSACVNKHSKKTKRAIVLLSCHYDVIEWLDPDWIIDCNKASFTDRRLLRRSRKEKIKFELRRVDRSTWKYFSKYHYLSDRLPGGHIETFGLFNGENQIGFQCFANYVPHRKKGTMRKKMHSNRIVIHPDYAGAGLGILVMNASSRIMQQMGYDVWCKFSSIPVYKAMIKENDWKLKKSEMKLNTFIGANMKRDAGFREKVKVYSFKWIGGGLDKAKPDKIEFSNKAVIENAMA